MIAYTKLTEQEKRQVALNLALRRKRYEQFVLGRSRQLIHRDWNVILVGDRPGPAAPEDPDYHHTPFYSVKHCSGWLNALLLKEGINENDLIWLNAYDRDGKPTDEQLIDQLLPKNIHPSYIPVIALGNHAAMWLRKAGYETITKVDHPQYHKRFKNKERYELPDRINDFLTEA